MPVYINVIVYMIRLPARTRNHEGVCHSDLLHYARPVIVFASNLKTQFLLQNIVYSI